MVAVGVFLWQTKLSPQNSPAALNSEAIEGEAIIIISDEGFSPSEIKIKIGTKVKFVNQSKYWHWPASDLHPTHTLYPEFDPKKPVGPGEEWNFVFEKTGEWDFHDHLASYVTGKIIVAE